MMKIFNKPKLVLIVVLILACIVIGSILLLPKKTDHKPLPTPSPTLKTTILDKPIKMSQVPIKPSDQGGGVDTQSQTIQQSEIEISKLKNLLPYEKSFASVAGKKISILIPSSDLQINPWTLTVQVFGVDYQTTPEYADYESMRSSFLEASTIVFDWMRSQGADPNKIIISWGGKEFIQQQAEKWLNE